jgi:hypothetical protein
MKYPKFYLLILTFLIAYLFLKSDYLLFCQGFILKLGLFGAFLAGIFYTYGFSSAFATVILILIGKENHFVLTGLIAGLGSVCGDLFIFGVIKNSFKDEIKKIGNEKIFKKLNHKMPRRVRKILLPILGAIFISSPLPDEIGVSILAINKTNTKFFSIFSYILNTFGIFIILLIGRVV